jgi:hypothetical protein
MFLIDSKEKIQEEANNYENLGAKNKTKNSYIFLIIILGIIDFFARGLYVDFALAPSELLSATILNLFLAIFIYFNHRWAMVIWALNFIATKIYMLFYIASLNMSGGAIIVQIFFGYIVFSAAFNSIRVSTALKRIKRDTDEKVLTKESQKKIKNSLEFSFFKKTKNLYLIFISLFILTNFFSSFDSGELASVYIGSVIISLILFAFIYFNHRWAMILWGLLYSMLQMLEITVTNILFMQVFDIALLAIVGLLTFISVKEATALKRLKKAI